MAGTTWQFKLAHLLALTTAYAAGFAIWRFSNPLWGGGLLISLTSIMVGGGLLAISDALDNRSVDERCWHAWVLNCVGIFWLSLSLIATLAALIMWLPGFVIGFWPDSPVAN